MLIVIEGCDGTGKTTLMSQLRDLLPLRASFVTRSKRPPTYYDICCETEWFEAVPRNQIVIVDRYPTISESVYGPLLRQENLVGGWPTETIVQRIDLIVYCRPATRYVIENVRKGTHLEGVEQRTEALLSRYDAVMHQIGIQSKVRKIEYDYVNDPLTKITRGIAECHRLIVSPKSSASSAS